MKTDVIPEQRGLTDLAQLYDYPEAEFIDMALPLCEQLCASYPAAAESLAKFGCELARYTVDDLEEIHTRTFSLSPVCVPYIGWQLFGENSFKRGEFLGNLAEMCKRHCLDVSPELPDHIGAMLHLGTYLPREDLTEMLEWCLIPGTDKMVTGTERLTTPYRHLLQATNIVLKDLQAKVQNG